MAKKRSDSGNPWPARCKAILEALAITQQQAADRVRVSRRAWVKWQGGKQVPSPAHQLLIELLEQGKI